ncbi:MAG TPA: aminodeoxychorismate synthase component I, partial [Bacteroidota bacterium]|nr:aminodeoxychorismate synthase component I [Bacteroidota bacterium]
QNRFYGYHGKFNHDMHEDGEVASISSLRPSVTEPEYLKAVRKIKGYIEDGDTYQVNHTFKLKFDFSGSAADLYCRLRNAQHVAFSAFIRLEGSSILSFSPELFFRTEKNAITLKPMKGTSPRGRTLEEDQQMKSELSRSEKNRAENLMIVDLLRNDVGKIARTGTVKVSKFFEIEKYDTVFQATSTIRAKLRPGWTVAEIIRSLFPSGSVTGAPKIRTMQIINEVETEPRGIYTGAIGFVSPKRQSVFNVAIRTVVLDHSSKTGEMGIGSGIVHDSIPEEEYRECFLKAKFLTEPREEFGLFETIRWDIEKGWSLLSGHLRRLRNSARYFDFKFSSSSVASVLHNCEKDLRTQTKGSANYRVKITLERDGSVSATHSELKPLADRQLAALSGEKTYSRDRFLFHKTTNRRIYDESLRRAEALGLFDFIFLNENDELTEGARSNLVVRKGEKYYTPPVRCGVLPGVFRAGLFTRRGIPVEEKALHVGDLEQADGVFLCNALRGMVKVQLVDIREHAREKSHAQLLAVED